MLFFRNRLKINTDLSAYAGRVQPVVLLVLDGWGIAPPSDGNAISRAKTPNFDRLAGEYPFGELIASGESVGLTANEEGNSEVGHLTMGAGRVVPQSLVRIDKSILDGSFYENSAFWAALEHTKRNGSAFHIAGLVGSGEVHSSIKHFWALLEFCEKNNVSQVYLHLFTDGRDAPPKEAKGIIEEIEKRISKRDNIKVVTVSGRYFAMDRDRRWDRTEKAYKAMVLGEGIRVKSAVEAVEKAYGEGKTDEFIEPSVVEDVAGKPVGVISDNDAVVFFNFRIDRPRQIVMALTMDNFEELSGFKLEYDPHHEEDKPKSGEESVVTEKTFSRGVRPGNLFVVSMTEYQKNIPVNAVAFLPYVVEGGLAEVLARAGKRQFHLAESEKERMVTYYFNGMREGKYEGEDDLIVPSPKVSTYDKKPEMSTFEIVGALRGALASSKYHFVVMNFACPDMVAHSGNIRATMKAVEAADRGLGMVSEMVLSLGGTLMITADHGNAEELVRYSKEGFYFVSGKGETDTKHSNNPVPVLVVRGDLRGKSDVKLRGTLGDVAPTILKIMGLEESAEMTGRNLLGEVNKK